MFPAGGGLQGVPEAVQGAGAERVQSRVPDDGDSDSEELHPETGAEGEMLEADVIYSVVRAKF